MTSNCLFRSLFLRSNGGSSTAGTVVLVATAGALVFVGADEVSPQLEPEVTR
jgi:hypothetical protein